MRDPCGREPRMRLRQAPCAQRRRDPCVAARSIRLRQVHAPRRPRRQPGHQCLPIRLRAPQRSQPQALLRRRGADGARRPGAWAEALPRYWWDRREQHKVHAGVNFAPDSEDGAGDEFLLPPDSDEEGAAGDSTRALTTTSSSPR